MKPNNPERPTGCAPLIPCQDLFSYSPFLNLKKYVQFSERDMESEFPRLITITRGALAPEGTHFGITP